VLDAINQLIAEKSDTEEQIIGLTEAKERIKQFRDTEINLDEWYVKAHKGIKDANNDTQRLAFDMLDLKVHAIREKVDIRGIIPIELATTEQTSGCRPVWAKSYSGINYRYRSKFIAPTAIEILLGY
jgi:hypothetical protein